MRRFFVKNVWWFTLLVASFLLMAHLTSFGNLKIDAVALALLAIMLLSPFASAVRRIRIGEFEAEIAPEEVASVRDQVERLESVPSSDERGSEQPPLIYRSLERITTLSESDPLLALVQLRFEIERVVDRLAHRSVVGRRAERPRPLALQIQELSHRDVISGEVASSLRRVVDICNRAAHGQAIRPQDATEIIDAGTSLVEQLHWRAVDRADRGVDHVTITGAELRSYENALYELITVTPYANDPRRSTRTVTQDELDDVLDGYNDYAEFIVGLRRLDEVDPASHPA